MNPLAAFQVLILTLAVAMAVEALRSSPKRTRIVFWALFGVLAVIGIATNSIAGAWPTASAAMVWIGSSPITLFFAFLAWVVFLQKPWRRPAQSGVDLATLGDATWLADDVRQLNSSVSSLTRIVDSNSATLGIMSGQLNMFSQDQSALKDRITTVDATLAAEAVGFKTALEHLKNEYAARHSLQADALSAQFNNLYLALQAVYDRERLKFLADEVIRYAVALRVPEGGFDAASWTGWLALEEEWRSNLERWCERAQPYRQHVQEVVFDTPEGLYRGDGWPDDQLFPNSIAVHAYKTFSLIAKNFEDIRGNVVSRVNQAAFGRRAAAIRAGDDD